eukprot:contig_19243_g4747
MLYLVNDTWPDSSHGAIPLPSALSRCRPAVGRQGGWSTCALLDVVSSYERLRCYVASVRRMRGGGAWPPSEWLCSRCCWLSPRSPPPPLSMFVFPVHEWALDAQGTVGRPKRRLTIRCMRTPSCEP